MPKALEIFSVGDRVCPNFSRDGMFSAGDPGTVRSIIGDGRYIGVEFDEFMGGHDLQKKCKDGYGWWFFRYELNHSIPDFHVASSDELRAFIAS